MGRFSVLLLMAVAWALMIPAAARADEAGDVRKAVQGFVGAYQGADEKGVRDAVSVAGEGGEAAKGYLDLMTATMRLRKAAAEKFGEAAGDFFLGVPAAQAEARSKAIREAVVKLTGHSAIMTIEADEKTRRPGGAIVLLKSGTAWKLDGATLFGVDAASGKERAALAEKLAGVTDQVAREIAAGQHADAMNALLEFWTRATAAAAAETPAPAANPAEATAPKAAPASPFRYAMPDRARALTDKEITVAINKAAEVLLANLGREISGLKNAAPLPLLDNAFSSSKNGQVALAIYAILTAGRVTGDPRFRASAKELAGPIDYLVSMREHETYTVALQAMALSMLPARAEVKRALAAARDELLQGSYKGIYTYQTQQKHETGDNSNTQYGQLGVWACQDAGLETPIGYWAAVDEYWRKTQAPNGGWGYTAMLTLNASGPRMVQVGPNGLVMQDPYASMTAAGVASLYLAQDYLNHTVELNPRTDPALDMGMDWLSNHFEQFHNQFAADLYLAFAIERVALASGYKLIGPYDWYREGAASILDAQREDMAWDYQRGGAAVGTSYALLFLSRGIAPLACAKLQYNGPWNARPRDCARFVHWLDKKTERTLNWQIVPIASSPRDWRTPLLVITGHGDPKFTAEQLGNLRQYVMDGGLILSSADGSDAAFTKAIRFKYAPALFGNEYEMRLLPDSHAVFQIDYKMKPPAQLHLWGLSNGVREVWIHSEDDLGSAWQAYTTAKTQHFEVPANIYFYATGRSTVPLKLEPLDKPAPPMPTLRYDVARIAYSGNFDPEPTAWPRFAEECLYRHAAEVRAVPTKVEELNAAKTPLAHMTGTTAFTLSDDQRQKLADYLNAGGVLIADATAGSDAFADSFKDLCKAMFPQDEMTAVPDDSPIVTGNAPGMTAIKEPERRRFADNLENRNRAINLQQLKHNGRLVILYSQGDLTAGLAGLRTWGIFGYTPETAKALMWNAVMSLETGTPVGAAPPQVAVAGAPAAGTAPAAGNVDSRKPQHLTEVYTGVSTPLGLVGFPK